MVQEFRLCYKRNQQQRIKFIKYSNLDMLISYVYSLQSGAVINAACCVSYH